MYAQSLQSCPTACVPMDCSPPGFRPWDSPEKNTGVGRHFLLQYSWASLVTQTVNTAYNAGYLGSIPGLGSFPGGRHGNPLQYSSLENPYGQRSLAGYSPWSPKESDTTERLSTSTRRDWECLCTRAHTHNPSRQGQIR